MKPIMQSRLTTQRISRPQRRGSSLIQLVVVMTVVSVMTTLAATFIIRLYRVEAGMVRHLAQTHVWQRVARDFRLDVHAARTAVLTNDPRPQLTLETDSGRIAWLAETGVIRRIVLSDAASGDPREQPGESYRFDDAQCRLAMRPAERPGALSVVELTIVPVSPGMDGNLPEAVTAALAGFDHRFETPEAQP